MNIKLNVLIIGIFLVSFVSQAQYHIQRNTAYLEAFGAAGVGFYSLNIDHIINEFHHNSEAVRLGFSFRPKNLISLNTGFNFMHGLKRQKDRYVELGGGVVYMYLLSKTIANRHDAHAYLSLGYRKQGTKKEPLFWKVAFTPLFATKVFSEGGKRPGWLGYFMPFIGLSIGYSF